MDWDTGRKAGGKIGIEWSGANETDQLSDRPDEGMP